MCAGNGERGKRENMLQGSGEFEEREREGEMERKLENATKVIFYLPRTQTAEGIPTYKLGIHYRVRFPRCIINPSNSKQKRIFFFFFLCPKGGM